MPPRPDRKSPRAPQRPARTSAARGLALWFVLGVLAAVPATFLYRSLAGGASGGAPGGLPAQGLSPEMIGRRVDDLCEKAGKLVAEERLAEAYEILLQAATLDPTDPRPHCGLGDVSKSLDYDQLAEKHYRKALEIEPGNQAIRVSLAMVLCDFGKNREAIDLLKEVEKEKPGDPFIWAELAVNALRLGNPREAIPLLERYNATQGSQAWGYENLGRAYADAGEGEKAERAFRRAIEIQPRTALAHLWLGQLLLGSGRKAEAEEHLKTFRQIRDLQTQARLLEQGINRNPDDPQTLVRLAHVRVLLGQDQKALVPLERALQLAPDDDRIRKLYESVKARVDSLSR